MLETLEGRLKWERTEEGIRVEIPARLTAKEGPYALSLGSIWLSLLIGDLLRWLFEGSHPVWAHWFHRSAVDSIPVIALAWTAWVALTSVRLVLDPSTLRLEYRVIGIRWLCLQTSTRLLHNPRFRGTSARIPRFLGSRPELQIDRDYRTRTLAVGTTEEEATALIAKMMGVYPFPKYLATETAAARGEESGHA